MIKRAFDFEGREYMIEEREGGLVTIMRIVDQIPICALVFTPRGLEQVVVNQKSGKRPDEIEAYLNQAMLDAYTSPSSRSFPVSREQLSAPAAAEWSAPEVATRVG